MQGLSGGPGKLSWRVPTLPPRGFWRSLQQAAGCSQEGGDVLAFRGWRQQQFPPRAPPSERTPCLESLSQTEWGRGEVSLWHTLGVSAGPPAPSASPQGRARLSLCPLDLLFARLMFRMVLSTCTPLEARELPPRAGGGWRWLAVLLVSLGCSRGVLSAAPRVERPPRGDPALPPKTETGATGRLSWNKHPGSCLYCCSFCSRGSSRLSTSTQKHLTLMTLIMRI